MADFSKAELGTLDLIASNKKLEDADKARVEELKARLGVSTQAEVLERFVAMTGWSNPPKDYPA